MQIILQSLSLIGALVIFLFGMKLMSESLQRLAGRNMRNILARITSRPGRGILTGFFITGLIQSSSATTVMLVSFVNAGLVSFTESLGVVFGANIGTTVTAWLISILGFGTNFSLYSIMLPLVALSLPLFFSYNIRNKTRAEFIIGFALLFIGIYFFRENIPEIDADNSLFHRLQFYDHSLINILMFVGLGILITIIFQSSSATITLTMILASQGWLSYHAALAMVLGENIGTTSTANFAAIIANRSAKRTALAHLLFNIIGVIWVLPFFNFFAESSHFLVDKFLTSEASHIAFGISVFHTCFNLVNTILLTIFFRPFRSLCFRLLPNGSGINEVFSLKYIDNTILSTAELSILQARKEIAHMAEQVAMIFSMIPDILVEKKDKKFAKLFRKIQKGEEVIDAMELEIAGYLTRIPEHDLSSSGRSRMNAMLKIINYLESIADFCYQLALTITKKNEAKAWFTQELRNNIDKEFNLIEKSMSLMINNLDKDYDDVEIEAAEKLNVEISQLRSELNKRYLEEISKEKIHYKTGVFYNDLLSVSEKIGDYIFKVNDTIHKINSTKSTNIYRKEK